MAEQRVQAQKTNLQGTRRGRRGTRLTPTIRASLARTAAAHRPGTSIRPFGAQQAARTQIVAQGRALGPRVTSLGATAGAVAGGAASTASKVAPSLLRRLGPLAAFIVPFVGLEGLKRIQELKGRGDEVKKSLEILRNPAARSQIIQKRLLRERLQENIIAAKLVRMQNVARNDPGLFKMLSGMVAGTRRPRTTPQTIRIGPEPSQLDLIGSGLF